ncbi:acyl-CoA thioesterase II [Aeromicrobium sp. 636]|uniref:Acyl-CoA thioesterase 2 n=1 Tax=Aeromicrobium senzhongii TaxID=2663859 RepID=A0A8I0JYI2_9ACTN|nr:MULTISPECIES: acyl-CoA thioesterase II [Aeromicrobium]MBC9224902.1 acyl-CoA thioesterase II [Aeromicrobium senzhongii]MCQ3997014.1 acyl-CoA thioesterase II [Aeromicrobium sp. 636]MTB86948.1 acyl-CoA thioesterase II [Aeromicrobium senzhongii]QNL93224.1 acyl-CoA thioesterase II [Aeromicrobium senzhongii]
MPASVNELVDLLDVEQLEVNLFRGGQPENSRLKRVFGGQVAGQAVSAAQRTVTDGKQLHSLHVYFILGGDPSIPIIYDVESVRDGRSFATRRVSARQHGEVIFYMTASFQKDEAGWDHQDVLPPTPGPDEATSMLDLVQFISPDGTEQWQQEWGGFDMRYVGDPRPEDDPSRQLQPVVQRMWFRAAEQLPDDPQLHRAAFTYYSDFSLLGAALVPHGVLISSPKVQPASLDHVVWFHRPFRADEWLLYDQTSPSASGARGLSTARVFKQDGTLVATVAQEGLIRPAKRPEDR